MPPPNARPARPTHCEVGDARRAFAEPLDQEPPLAALEPSAPREDQLANLRRIYPPECEALGVVAIGARVLEQP